MKEIKHVEWDKLSHEEQKTFTGIVFWATGSQSYYQNGKYHRENGPAYIGYSGFVEYLQDGKLHRIDGPARIWPKNIVQYWIHGKEVTKEAQELYYSLMKLKGLI